jgi:PleD family two-component response regulator
LNSNCTNLRLANRGSLIRIFNSVVDRITDQVEKGFAEGVYDPSIKPGLARFNLHLHPPTERNCELTRVIGQASEERFQRLNLETQQRVELTIAEASEDPLPGLELHRDLSQRCRKRRQHLSRISIADALLGEGGEPKYSVRETFRGYRYDPQAGASVGQIVDHDGLDP